MTYTTYDQWFTVFVIELRKLGYSGEIEKEYYRFHFENDMEPDVSAKQFIEEL